MNRASEISRRPFENNVDLTFYFDLPSSNRFSFPQTRAPKMEKDRNWN